MHTRQEKGGGESLPFSRFSRGVDSMDSHRRALQDADDDFDVFTYVIAGVLAALFVVPLCYMCCRLSGATNRFQDALEQREPRPKVGVPSTRELERVARGEKRRPSAARSPSRRAPRDPDVIDVHGVKWSGMGLTPILPEDFGTATPADEELGTLYAGGGGGGVALAGAVGAAPPQQAFPGVQSEVGAAIDLEEKDRAPAAAAPPAAAAATEEEWGVGLRATLLAAFGMTRLQGLARGNDVAAQPVSVAVIEPSRTAGTQAAASSAARLTVDLAADAEEEEEEEEVVEPASWRPVKTPAPQTAKKKVKGAITPRAAAVVVARPEAEAAPPDVMSRKSVPLLSASTVHTLDAVMQPVGLDSPSHNVAEDSSMWGDGAGALSSRSDVAMVGGDDAALRASQRASAASLLLASFPSEPRSNDAGGEVEAGDMGDEAIPAVLSKPPNEVKGAATQRAPAAVVARPRRHSKTQQLVSSPDIGIDVLEVLVGAPAAAARAHSAVSLTKDQLLVEDSSNWAESSNVIADEDSAPPASAPAAEEDAERQGGCILA